MADVCPNVSIVVPCYNGAQYLRETLESAVGQTYRQLEIIVVDDGSTDGSEHIAASFGGTVRVIRQANRGESAARNVGVEASRGDYVLFLDADDLLERQALERLMDSVRGVMGGVALMGCAWFEHDPQRPSAVRLPGSDSFFPRIIQTNLGPPHTWLAPKRLITHVGGFEMTLQMYEDWHLWCRVALSGATLVPVNHIGAFYRRHPGSQLAKAASADVARGHVRVMDVLCSGMLKSPQLLRQHGSVLFWATWTAMHRARASGVSWSELRGVASYLEEMARRGPKSVTGTRFARLIRCFGTRWAEIVRSAIVAEPRLAIESC